MTFGSQVREIACDSCFCHRFALASVGLVTQHINSGAMKFLGVPGTTRSSLLPEVPTLAGSRRVALGDRRDVRSGSFPPPTFVTSGGGTCFNSGRHNFEARTMS